VLDLLGLEPPTSPVHGRSLLPLFDDPAVAVNDAVVSRYFDGALPAPVRGKEGPEGKRLRAAAEALYDTVDARYRAVAVSAANTAALDLIRAIDGYIEQTQPFRLAKDETQRDHLATILYYCAEALRIASLALHPVLPGKTAQLWSQLSVEYDTTNGDLAAWCQWGGLEPGAAVSKGEPLFPRVVAEKK